MVQIVAIWCIKKHNKSVLFTDTFVERKLEKSNVQAREAQVYFVVNVVRMSNIERLRVLAC